MLSLESTRYFNLKCHFLGGGGGGGEIELILTIFLRRNRMGGGGGGWEWGTWLNQRLIAKKQNPPRLAELEGEKVHCEG